MRYRGSKRSRNIVMKSNWKREQMPSHDIIMDFKDDLFNKNKLSKCCKHSFVVICGSFRCLKCDKYCEIE